MRTHGPSDGLACNSFAHLTCLPTNSQKPISAGRKQAPRGQALRASAPGTGTQEAPRGQALTYCGPIDNTGFFVTLYIITVKEKQNDSSKERTSQY